MVALARKAEGAFHVKMTGNTLISHAHLPGKCIRPTRLGSKEEASIHMSLRENFFAPPTDDSQLRS